MGLGSQLKDWYTKAASIPYGHLLLDLTPKTVDSLRFCTNSGSIPAIFFLPQHKQQATFLSDEHTTSLYSDNVPMLFPELQKNLPKKLSKRIYLFLNECIVNLLRGKMPNIQKRDVIKYQDKTHQLILKRTGINKRRAILSSWKGIELISILTPSIINRLS